MELPVELSNVSAAMMPGRGAADWPKTGQERLEKNKGACGGEIFRRMHPIF
jgi:hypothetical protein